MRSKYVLILPLLVLFFSCEKENGKDPADSRVSEIIMGSASADEVSYVLDTEVKLTMPSVVTKEKLKLDLNEDGVSDLEVVCSKQVNFQWTKLKPLDDRVFLHCFAHFDTVYEEIQLDTQVFFDLVRIYQTTIQRSTHVLGVATTNYTSKEWYPQGRSAGTTLSLNDEWTGTTMTLRKRTTIAPEQFGLRETVGDTSFYHRNHYLTETGPIPQNESVYCGFKFEDRLGWIKLQQGSDYSVVVSEVALQD